MSVERQKTIRTERSVRNRLRSHRRRLRAAGYRRVHFWLPDLSSPAIEAEMAAEAEAIRASEHEAEDQAFVDAISGLDEAW